jgi:hypothetical protein
MATDFVDFNNVTIRTLTSADAERYKAIRLHALDVSGHYFTADRQDEMDRPQEAWAAVCAETCVPLRKVIIAAEELSNSGRASRLVGVLSATEWIDDPSGTTVRWGSAYILPTYSGIGHHLYPVREAWSFAAGFRQAVFTVRADNERSLAIHLRHGAVIEKECDSQFADGSHGPLLWLRKPIVSVFSRLSA